MTYKGYYNLSIIVMVASIVAMLNGGSWTALFLFVLGFILNGIGVCKEPNGSDE